MFINYTVQLTFAIGSFETMKSFKFAVVPGYVLPHCFLLGLDFMDEFNIGLDFMTKTCKQNFVAVAPFIVCDPNNVNKPTNSLMIVSVADGSSHQVQSSMVGEDIRFEVKGSSSSITGLSLLIENDLIKHVQSRSSELRLLYKCVKNNRQPRDWPERVSHSRRYAKKICVSRDNILV